VTFRDQAILAALPGTIRARSGLYIRSMNVVPGPQRPPTCTYQESLEAAVDDAVGVADLAVKARRRVAGKEGRT
jgi:hypothetical protein